MTKNLTSLVDVASDYDAIVFDQWGVLHDGSLPYASSVKTLEQLHLAGAKMAVLSNSGKRAEPNAARIAEFGFATDWFEEIMTSGEALWRDVQAGQIDARSFFPIERRRGDAALWAKGLDIDLTVDLAEAEAVLLMGLPDIACVSTYSEIMQTALDRDMPVFCSNPDRSSPRGGGKTVTSPGALAFAHLEKGGDVTFYGKPHRPIFDVLQNALAAKRLLMVGDSLEHDITGGNGAGWDTVFVKGGLYAADFAEGASKDVLARLLKEKNAPEPTFLIEVVQ